MGRRHAVTQFDRVAEKKPTEAARAERAFRRFDHAF